MAAPPRRTAGRARGAATRCYRDTHDLAGPQRLLGHADPKTTMVYVVDSLSDRERLMLRASDEPTQADIDREAA